MTGARASGDKCPTSRGHAHVRGTAGAGQAGTSGVPDLGPRPRPQRPRSRLSGLCPVPRRRILPRPRSSLRPAFCRPSVAHLAQASGFRGLRLPGRAPQADAPALPRRTAAWGRDSFPGDAWADFKSLSRPLRQQTTRVPRRSGEAGREAGEDGRNASGECSPRENQAFWEL